LRSTGLGCRDDDVEHRASEHVGRLVTEEALAVLVKERDPSLGIPPQDDAVDILDALSVHRFPSAQLLYLETQRGNLAPQRLYLGR
jgi:hypothetical protein